MARAIPEAPIPRLATMSREQREQLVDATPVDQLDALEAEFIAHGHAPEGRLVTRIRARRAAAQEG